MYEIDAALERLDDVFRSTTEKDINKSRQNLTENIKTIEFKNVVFQYGFKDPIIKGLNLKINSGESVGVIGTSGSGKTTLIKLIMNFYNVTERSNLS
jgi:ATP-binding cassette subfamily B protein